MLSFVMSSRLASDSLREPEPFPQPARTVSREIRAGYAGVHWRERYTLLGPYDLVDRCDPPSEAIDARIVLLIRSRAEGTTESAAVHCGGVNSG